MVEVQVQSAARSVAPQDRLWDVVILGGGPAGMAAGLYTGRALLSTLIIEKAVPGGQIANTYLVEDYPGFLSIEGPELARKMEEQARHFGAEIVYGDIESVDLKGGVKTVLTSEGTYRGRTVIVATGASPRKLGVPGEDELAGRGVSYCAICDGAFFKGEKLAVIGGGDSALDEGYFLARYASKVTIIHRRDEFRAVRQLVERARQHPKVEFLMNRVVERIEGDGKVERLILRDTRTGERSAFPVGGVFVYIGMIPNTGFLKGQLKLDDRGYVPAPEDCATGIPGVFVAGDVRYKFLRQLTTAVADGSVAAMMAEKYLLDQGVEPGTKEKEAAVKA